jgi:GT2 family glycosyltransferase
MERDQLKFAAFVMTYKRQGIAKQTIEALFNQTVPPAKVLIIDNDELQSGKIIQEQLGHLPIDYHAVGFNSGPAGAATIGLKMLAEEGYQWVAWIDDDDPPYFPDVFEKLLHLASQNPKCGSVGVVGQYFNQKKGLIQRVPNRLLESHGCLQVDTIAGGMIKLVNSNFVNESGILPDASLFFGFEELDYDLQIQKSGYTLLVDKELFLRHRIYHNRLDFKKQKTKKTERQLVRDYYSTRNMLIILNKNKLRIAFCYTFLRVIYKCISSFRYGLQYGFKNVKHQTKAIYHYTLNS